MLVKLLPDDGYDVTPGDTVGAALVGDNLELLVLCTLDLALVGVTLQSATSTSTVGREEREDGR